MRGLAHHSSVSVASLAVPAVLLAALLGALAIETGLVGVGGGADAFAGPQTVTVPPRTFMYRSEGDFSKEGVAVDGPLLTVAMTAPLEIMKYQVTVEEYALCVSDGACIATDAPPTANAVNAALPVTGVSYADAEAYAEWLSKRTGQVWRLPTDRQWAFAAGDRFADDALGIPANSKNPALRWLADYERESARQASRDPTPQPLGTFGENAYGLADLAGNVWEWSTTCHRRVSLDAAGAIVADSQACGIYLTEGKHRAPLSFFIRDAKSGGCSVGTPPDNLGFRLVRDHRWYAPAARAIRVATGFDI